MSKLKPILFSAPMVRALLDGRKSQTRRIVKPPKVKKAGPIHTFAPAPYYGHGENGQAVALNELGGMVAVNGWGSLIFDCPYGKPGDLLWVREGWGEIAHIDYADPSCEPFVHRCGPDERFIVYREEAPRYGFEWLDDGGDKCGWKPSIHMHRFACRLVLRVTEVRVERLQQISETDAIAEGLEWHDGCGKKRDEGWVTPAAKGVSFTDPRKPFEYLWESINGAGSWAANPWVWAVHFEVAAKTNADAQFLMREVQP